MNTFTQKILLAFFLFGIASCAVQSEFDEFPRASTGIYFGSESELYSSVQGSDSTFVEISYNLAGLSETDTEFEKILNVDVEYAGGEGGCPSTKFFLQWDESFQNVTDSTKQVTLGLAGFLVNSNITCEALVRETLEYDLRDLFDDDLPGITQIKVVNLHNNMADSLVRGE